jgi:hypothetical protein
MSRELHQISDSILKAIDDYCQKTYDDGHRTHLGASIIGDKCKAKLWFTFRWVYHFKHSGQKERLFNTGHKEEERIIEWLRGSGFTVYNIDPKTNKQFRISGVNGHYGGSMDGIVFISDLGECLLECKTNKDGSDFNNLFENGFKTEKEKHWAQVCSYGEKWNLKHVVYINKNKNNDKLYVEVAILDENLGKQMEIKAKEIIYAKARPQRIAETPAYFECKYCDYIDVCHKGKAAEKNCRSCKFSEPVENAEWKCNKYNSVLPKEFIPKGCDLWEGII